jgi:hypothetical protein
MLPRFVAKARSDWIEAIFVLITRAITWFSVEISPATGWPLRASNSRANDFPWLASTFSCGGQCNRWAIRAFVK